jgi:hypothetical protein
MKPTYLAEGSYGCVHNPSLLCKDKPKMNYVDKVSKILYFPDLDKEMDEYDLIGKADKKLDFHLGTPETCMPKYSAENRDAIKSCKQMGKSILKDFQSYSVLIMNDGGLNYEQYGDKLGLMENTVSTCTIAELFWIESRRLLQKCY